MDYSFYLISREKKITQEDFDKAFSNLSRFNRCGVGGNPLCDIYFTEDYVRISGSFAISGKHAEGFVLNFLMCLLDLDYKIKVLSGDWEYGTESDWNWLNSLRIKQYDK